MFRAAAFRCIAVPPAVLNSDIWFLDSELSGPELCLLPSRLHHSLSRGRLDRACNKARLPAMTIVRQQMPLADLDAMAKAQFGDLVKAVVDVERGLMAIGGELHSDEEALLLEDGSNQLNLWV